MTACISTFPAVSVALIVALLSNGLKYPDRIKYSAPYKREITYGETQFYH
jgi:hypothetical protein